MAEEEKTTVTVEKLELKRAEPEDMKTLILQECFTFNIIHDVNKAIEMLRLFTTDFSEEDDSMFYIEPKDLMRVYTHLYLKLERQYDKELTPINADQPCIVMKTLTFLAYMTWQFIHKNIGKLKAKGGKTREEAEWFMEIVEDLIFDKEWTRFDDWATL